VEVFWIVTPCSVVVGYFWNFGNLLQNYTVSQPRRPPLGRLNYFITQVKHSRSTALQNESIQNKEKFLNSVLDLLKWTTWRSNRVPNALGQRRAAVISWVEEWQEPRLSGDAVAVRKISSHLLGIEISLQTDTQSVCCQRYLRTKRDTSSSNLIEMKNEYYYSLHRTAKWFEKTVML
jgi:hypothetical protein